MSALRGSIGRIGPSGATAGAALGPDADPLAAAEVGGASGVVVVRIAPGVLWAGAIAGCEVFVDGTVAAGADDWPADAPLGSGGAAAVGAGAAAPGAGLAMALTALRHDADN